MNELTLSTALETALKRIEDMLSDYDGQAFKEARKFLPVGRDALAALRSMPAEPVALIVRTPYGSGVRLQWASVEASHNNKPGPLYAAPPAQQPLTDEQINPHKAAAELRRLAAENAALRKDAERYRWLLSRIYVDPEQLILRIKDLVVLDDGGSLAEMIDAAIDAAMREALAAPQPAQPAEPVAWMRPSENGYDDSAFRDHSTVVACTGNPWTGWIPLYTHPAPAQPPLTEAQYIAASGDNSKSGRRGQDHGGIERSLAGGKL